MQSKAEFSPVRPTTTSDIRQENNQNGIRQVTPYKEDERLPCNKVHTSKYTKFTFLPLNLAEQFSKAPNLYFLMIGLLQTITAISPTRGVPTMYIPLSIIVFFTALKDLYQDRQRSVSDSIENSRTYQRLQENQQTSQITSKQIRVGTVIRVRKNQIIPCDGLILGISEANKYAFVSTSNLDGQMHLKRRMLHFCLKERSLDQKSVNSGFTVSCEKPSPDYHQFEGNIHCLSQNRPIDENHVCLRGTKLKNTEYIHILALYTGQDTKILLNMAPPHAKYSSLEKRLKTLILVVFLTIVCQSFILALFHERGQSKKHLEQPHRLPVSLLISFFSWVLNLTNLIPISLLVTLESVCLIQGKIISSDPKMYTNNYKPLVNTSNIMSDLGTIHRVASDKTGTLTKNELRVKVLSDYSGKYSLSDSNVPLGLLELLSICHTGYVSGEQFQSVSQDQVAILDFCRSKEVVLLDRNQVAMELLIGGQDLCVNVLHNIQFTSQRRRQSILVEKRGGVFLITKGSDCQLRKLTLGGPQEKKILEDVIEFAKSGLRTMVIAVKQVDRQQLQHWMQRLVFSKNVNDKTQIRLLEEELEQGLTMAGAIGVEDQLQDQVVEVIQQIIGAGIQFTIISGDRPQTVMSIAHNLGLDDEPFLCPVNQYKKQYQAHKFLVFARCTPKDKRKIVVAMEGNVLAIGDGANDVSMLTAATFGVGVAGKEGRAAAQSSDIAVGEFKCLKRLLFFYGRQTCRKNSYMITYNFYKNFLYTLPLIIFGTYSSYTGVAIYETYLGQFYNTFFTAVPIFLFALIDESETQFDLENNVNDLYKSSQSLSYFDFKSLFFSLSESILLGVMSSLLCFKICPLLYISPYDMNLYETSSVIMLYVVIYSNYRILVKQRRMGLIIFVTSTFGVVFYIVFFDLMLYVGALASQSLNIFLHQTVFLLLLMILLSLVISLTLTTIQNLSNVHALPIKPQEVLTQTSRSEQPSSPV